MQFNGLNKLALAGLIAAQAALTFAQNNPSTYSASVTYNEGDIAKIGVNYYRALNTNINKYPTNNTGSWELYRVRGNNTVSPPVYQVQVGVGHSFTNLYTAWNYVANAIIDKGTVVELFIDTSHGAFTESFASAFNLDSPCGNKIQIVGDNAANINLNFPNVLGGIEIDNGNKLGLLENVTINGPGSNLTDGVGLDLDNDSFMTLENVIINNFGFGVVVGDSSRLKCLQSASGASITVDNFYQGIGAQDNSYIYCEGASLTGGANAHNGIVAANHAEIDASEATVSTVSNAYQCQDGSTMIATESSCSNVVEDGYYATGRAYITATGASGNYFYAANGGYINASNSTSTSGYGTDSGLGSVVNH